MNRAMHYHKATIICASCIYAIRIMRGNIRLHKFGSHYVYILVPHDNNNYTSSSHVYMQVCVMNVCSKLETLHFNQRSSTPQIVVVNQMALLHHFQSMAFLPTAKKQGLEIPWHSQPSYVRYNKQLTYDNHESAQWSPDLFPHERVGSGHKTTC